MRALREQFEARPLFVFACALVVGMATSYQLAHALFLIPLVILASTRRTFIVLGLAAGLGFVRGPGGQAAMASSRQYVEGQVEVVSAARPDPRGERLVVQSGSLRLLLVGDNLERADLGDVLEVRGIVTPPSESSETSWRIQGVSGRLQPIRVKVLKRGPAWVRWGNDLRRSFVAYSRANMPGEAAVVANAICFNHDVDLAPELRDALRRSGTIHVVSTSGLHVMLLAFGVMKVLTRFPVPRGAQLLLLGALLALYVAAAGLRAPAVRASVLAMLFFGAYRILREEDSLSALAGAGAGYLLWEPHGLFDPGLQLSFAIFGSLLVFAERDPALQVGRVSIRTLLAGSVVAWLASAPLVAYHFGWLSWVGILSNLVIAPIVPLAVATPLICWSTSYFLGPVSAWVMARVATPMAYGIVWVASVAGGPEWVAMATPPFSAYWLPLIYGCAIVLWRPRVRPAP